MGSKARPTHSACENCQAPSTFEIWWNDNHGMNELLEVHCNQCGCKTDFEGNPTKGKKFQVESISHGPENKF